MLLEHLREIAEQDSTRPALVTRGRQLTYGELLTRMDRAAAGFAAMGMGPIDTVGLSIGDEIEHLVACLGLLAAGTTQVTLSTFDPAEANASLARAAGVNVVLCDDVSQSPGDIPRLGWNDSEWDGTRPASMRSGRLLLRTSGTTGVGKLVAYDETQLALQSRDVGHYDGHRYLRPASVEHNNGKRHRLYCLFAGGTNVLMPAPERDIARVCREMGVSLLDLSLMHAEDLIRRDDRTSFRGVSIQTAGSAMPYRIRRLLQERVSANLYVRYGATECGTIAMAGPDQHDEDEVVGLPADGVEARIVDDGGQLLATGTSGRIGIRVPGMASEYVNAPIETATRFVGGWFYPGDIGRFRADGCLIVEGRADDMMILNGLNIFPQEKRWRLLRCRLPSMARYRWQPLN
jgi:long-chain acyl-CoA synthetase